MKYKEFKNAVEDWGRVYGYKPTVNVDYLPIVYIEIAFEGEYYTDAICAIHKSKRFVLDLNWNLFINLSENAKHHLFEIVTEFAATKPEEREWEEVKEPVDFMTAIEALDRGKVIYAINTDGGREIFSPAGKQTDWGVAVLQSQGYAVDTGTILYGKWYIED